MMLKLLWLDIQKLFSIRLLLVFIVLPTLFAFNGWFVAIAYLISMYLVPYGMFSHDDTSIADNFYGALPVRREQRVAARYLFALFCMALMAALMLAVNTICALLFGWPLLAGDFIAALILGAVVGLLFICVAFPLIMHMGAAKANYYVLMVFVLAFLALSFSGDGWLATPPLSMPGLALMCLLALLVSFQTCLRLYRKHEFYDYVPMQEVHRAKKDNFFHQND